MSTPNPHGENGRPLTRRELRELAEQQATLAATNPPANAAPQPAFPPASPPQASAQSPAQPAPTGYRAEGGVSQAPVRRTASRPAPTRSGPGANAPIPHEAISRNSRSNSPNGGFGSQQYPAQTQQSAPETSTPPAQPRAASPTPDLASEQGALRARPVVTPAEQPVQVTRRSMYTQAPAAGVPQVTPPAQAGAVRMLEETGTLSRLVDPREFEPSRTPVAPPQGTSADRARMLDAHTANNPAVSRSNLAGFMRQAPPSSQIPRVEKDEHGNWRASSGAQVQERVEQDAAVLPQWDAASSPFTEFSTRVGQAQDAPSFTPEQRVENTGLPARASGFPPQSTGAVPGAAGPAMGAAFAGLGVAGVAGVASTAGAGVDAGAVGVSNPAAGAVAPPAWDAITNIDSTLPVDPTAGGVAVSSLFAQTQQSPQHSPLQQDSAGAFGGLVSPQGLRGPIVDEPTAAMTAVSQELPVSFAPGSGDLNAQENSPFGTPNALNGQFGQGAPAGLSSALTSHDDDEDLEDEDIELDHSYTWLHYMILVAVAFVLGMVIWKVGLDSPPANTGSETEAASVSVSVGDIARRA